MEIASLPPIIPCPGGKSRVSAKILKEFPEKYDTYVEPFVGGGSIFFRETKARVRVINDKDPQLVNFYRKFSRTPCAELKKCNVNVSKEKFRTVCNTRGQSVCNYLTASKKSWAGFCEHGGYSHTTKGITNIVSKCEAFKQKLQNTKIYNDDWLKVAKKYDGPGSVIYADPPYTKKSFKYRIEGVQPKEVCEFAKHAKGKVIISYDDSPAVREACKGLNFKKIDFCYGMANSKGGSCKPFKELLIKNF